MTIPAWCAVDDCPTAICGGPHREVHTTFGVEIIRDDQEPIGAELETERTKDNDISG